MGDSHQQTQSSSGTKPWGPTIPDLRQIIRGIGGLPGWNATGYEQNALDQMKQYAKDLPNFGPQAEKMAGNFMSGDPFGMLKSGLTNYQNQMNPIANADLDPTKTPGLANVLSTIQSDVGNNVNSLFAGAGRDLSGMHAQALGRGISQGEAVPLLNQYNQNVAQRMSAANGLLGASGSTSTAMGQNQQTGLSMAKNLPSMYNIGPQAMLAASQAERGLPIQNLAQRESLLLPMAGLGSTTKTNSFSESSPSVMSQIQQAMQLAGTAAGMGGMGAGMMPSMPGGMNPFSGFTTGNYFPQNTAAQGATPNYFGGQYFPQF